MSHVAPVISYDEVPEEHVNDLEYCCAHWKQQLDSTVANANRLIRQYADSAHLSSSNHRRDIALIGEELLLEATNRGWCSDFDNFVSSINERLYQELPTRIKKYSVVKTYQVTVSMEVETAPDNIEDEVSNLSIDDFITHISEADEVEEYDSDYSEL